MSEFVVCAQCRHCKKDWTEWKHNVLMCCNEESDHYKKQVRENDRCEEGEKE